MKKLLLFLEILLLFSCSSVKIKDQSEDFPILKGHVKKIEFVSQMYSSNQKPSSKVEGVIFYDRKNNRVKESDCYNDFKCDSTQFKYNDLGLLLSIVNVSPDAERSRIRIEYEYDKKGNVIIDRDFQEDSLFNSSKNEYDTFNNLVKTNVIMSSGKKTDILIKYKYDYKNRYFTRVSNKESAKKKSQGSRLSFNKKGFIIKQESFDENLIYTLITTFEYDNYGNVTKQSFYDKTSKLTSSNTFDRVFDKKGNVIVKESYKNDKLYDRTTCKITYW